jgi:phosphatidylserine decarboxylase
MIAPEGWPFILIPMCAGIATVVLGWPVAGWILIGFGVFGLFFFRNPDRTCEAPANVACSPADGRIIAVDDAPGELAERGLPQRISVFMSVFNVHVNRAPLDGTLVEYRYNPGKKVSAFKEKASLANEQNLSVWETPVGKIAFKQIAGSIARRIVFDHAVGDTVRRGDRVGLIRYGSRVDIFLPADAEVLVRVGDRVRAGTSGVARYPVRETGQP